MRNKVLFLLLFPLVFQTIVSCCNCPEPKLFRYTNKALTVYNIDNSGAAPVVSTSGPIIKTAYGIRLQLTREKTARNSRNPFSVQAAYAWDCFCDPERQFLPKDSIVSIRIVTLNDFDNNHPSNTDVSAYFKVYRLYSFSTIGDYLAKEERVFYDESQLELRLDLLLMTPPAINIQHRFKIQVTLSDGRILQAETTQTDLI